MQYKPKYFNIKELVNPELLKKFSEALLWIMFDPQLLKAADYIREKYGVVYVNYAGMTDCGARLPDSKTGVQNSPHKIFRALDLHVKSIEDKGLVKAAKIKAYDDLRLKLLADKNIGYLNYENGVSWLHIDTYNRASRVFNP